jgi:DNA-directed RNA polymerase subunit omega
MRDDYLQAALKVIDDPNVLVNVVSVRVKQLKRGNRALIESLEKLLPEDMALREIAEGKITYELATEEEINEDRRRKAAGQVSVSNVRAPTVFNEPVKSLVAGFMK